MQCECKTGVLASRFRAAFRLLAPLSYPSRCFSFPPSLCLPVPHPLGFLCLRLCYLSCSLWLTAHFGVTFPDWPPPSPTGHDSGVSLEAPCSEGGWGVPLTAPADGQPCVCALQLGIQAQGKAEQKEGNMLCISLRVWLLPLDSPISGSVPPLSLLKTWQGFILYKLKIIPFPDDSCRLELGEKSLLRTSISICYLWEKQ